MKSSHFPGGPPPFTEISSWCIPLFPRASSSFLLFLPRCGFGGGFWGIKLGGFPRGSLAGFFSRPSPFPGFYTLWVWRDIVFFPANPCCRDLSNPHFTFSSTDFPPTALCLTVFFVEAARFFFFPPQSFFPFRRFSLSPLPFACGFFFWAAGRIIVAFSRVTDPFLLKKGFFFFQSPFFDFQVFFSRFPPF